MARTTYTHLMRGESRTYCGKPAGFHLPLRATTVLHMATCPRCLAAHEAAAKRARKAAS